MLTVRLATPEDASSLASRLRQDDINEILAVGLLTPEEALLVGVSSPDPCFVAVDEQDIPQIIFGTYPSQDPFLGYVWMLASEEIRGNWVQVLRNTKPWVERVKGHYKVLANAVHADNTLHIKWLRWAGFTLLRQVNYRGKRFYEFAKLFNPEDI